jgi:hypothetical protein
MNHMMVAFQLAEMIVDITDPKITRWEKEQREANARAKAKNYIKKLEDK